ncbi:response regulator [Flammeovirga aprica]|uniref:Response regulator transcription factor n=1 Tax=Flammeovirga aprica JL-4 TaxID=694437 RepID=A0A7X9XBQ9_9BACT|nr:response regulator transcription factor [Flammeovirga aprica]NME71006.1 response regulator transcription factor [Flammeovirga aprica JL-4]
MLKHRILLVDDHEIFRNGVKQLVNKEEDLEVVAEASNGEEAIPLVASHHIDVVIMDISMPKKSGLEAAELLLSESKDTRILFLSLYDREDYIIQAVKVGACGYILKDESNKTFLKAIRKVAAGKFYFSGDTSDIIVKSIREDKFGSSSTAKTQNTVSLSKRESQILNHLMEGLDNKEISEMHSVSIRTIETHRLNILRKLSVKTIEQAIEKAKKLGIV